MQKCIPFCVEIQNVFKTGIILFILKLSFIQIEHTRYGAFTNKVHVVMQKQDDINEIRRKFKRILSVESRNLIIFVNILLMLKII